MRYQHVHLEVQDLSVEAEEFCDTLVHYPIPLIVLPFDGRCTEADAVAPVVSDLSNLVLEALLQVTFFDFVRILNKLQNELIKVSFDIDTLQLWIDIFIHKHEVRVYLKSSVFTHNYSDLIALLCLRVNFRDGAILNQRWFIR